MSTEVLWARTYDKGGDNSFKMPFIPKTDYEKKLAEFSKPKTQLFTSTDPARGYHITDDKCKLNTGQSEVAELASKTLKEAVSLQTMSEVKN
jgi:hypothetical protein